MKLTHTIDCQTRAVASLAEDGSLQVKAFASTEYAPGQSTTAEVQAVDIPEPLQAAVRTSLAAVLEHAGALLGKRIGRAVHKSAEVAAAHGEI